MSYTPNFNLIHVLECYIFLYKKLIRLLECIMKHFDILIRVIDSFDSSQLYIFAFHPLHAFHFCLPSCRYSHVFLYFGTRLAI